MTATSTEPGPPPPARPPHRGRLARLLRDPKRQGGPESGHTRRAGRLWRARPDDPAWARPALLGLLAATALLYLVGLGRNGWANEFYAAAAQAGTESWKAFLFGSLDSASFITVDKPPAFLWVMELSARVFGVNYWSLLVPQALEGVATVGVLYTTVRRWFGPPAALIAGAVVALAPVATLIFRFNDPDALLTLTMTLAAYAVTRAIETGRTRWLVAAGALLGLGFLAKMLAAFLVLPALALAYLWAGPPRLGRRIAQLLAGGGALLVTGGWWVAVSLLTPAAGRPFVGSSTDDNILQLTFGYNGLSRLTGGGGGRGGAFAGAARAAGTAGAAGAAGAAGRGAGAGTPGGFGGGGFVGGSGFGAGPGGGGGSSITRLFGAEWGGQISWLIPAALIACAAVLWLSRRAVRTDRTRAAALVWGGWLVVAGLVLSFMSGTTHSYYSIALAPAIGALTGIGAVGLWRIRHTRLARAVLAVALVITGAWAWVLLGRAPGWFPWLRVVIVLAALAAAGLIVIGPVLRAVTGRARAGLGLAAGSLALVAVLGGPLAYSLATAAGRYGGSSPSAGPALTAARGGALAGRGALGGRGEAGRVRYGAGFFGGGGPGGGNATVSSALVRLLRSGASRYTWAAATDGSDTAASMELAAGGVPVMAIGGFVGTDPAPTLAEFEKLVASHRIHYYMAGGAGGFPGRGAGRFAGPGARGFADRGARGFADRGAGGAPGRGTGGSRTDAAQISAWVSAHFTASTVSGTTVYNLAGPMRR